MSAPLTPGEIVAELRDEMIEAVPDVAVDAALLAIRSAYHDFNLSEDNERRLCRVSIAAAQLASGAHYTPETERLRGLLGEALNVLEEEPVTAASVVAQDVIERGRAALASGHSTEDRIEWWDNPSKNERLFWHLGCDEDNKCWIVPLDDCEAPTQPTWECARCAAIVPLAESTAPTRNSRATFDYDEAARIIRGLLYDSGDRDQTEVEVEATRFLAGVRPGHSTTEEG